MFALLATPLFAHRLDEYLQSALVSVTRDSVEVELSLTPGTSVFPAVMAAIDADGDGIISPDEQRVYARRVLADMTLTADDRPIAPELKSVLFPPLEDLRAGLGQIHLDLISPLAHAGRRRTIGLENRHLSRLSAYQVNVLTPSQSEVRIGRQIRNYQQSSYKLEYERTDLPPDNPLGVHARWLTALAVLFSLRMVYLHQRVV